VADVVQETFMAAARSARKFDPARGSVWLWLCGIARNYVALHYRKEARQERLKAAAERLALSNGRAQAWLQGGEPLPAEVLETAELATLVRCALAELSPEYETLLTARYLDDISVDNLRKRSKRR
jgi:RNA polymerase sigma-70 factor (ECF subfamily)